MNLLRNPGKVNFLVITLLRKALIICNLVLIYLSRCYCENITFVIFIYQRFFKEIGKNTLENLGK